MTCLKPASTGGDAVTLGKHQLRLARRIACNISLQHRDAQATRRSRETSPLLMPSATAMLWLSPRRHLRAGLASSSLMMAVTSAGLKPCFTAHAEIDKPLLLNSLRTCSRVLSTGACSQVLGVMLRPFV